jgi:Family of unknown function (DUF5329)
MGAFHENFQHLRISTKTLIMAPGKGKGADMADTHAIDTWLKRLALVSVMVLVALTCFLMWRVSMVALRIEQTLAASSDDVKQISQTAAGVATQVDELERRLADLTQALEGMSEWSELQREFGDAVLPGDAVKGQADGACDEEVRYLLERIRESGLQFQQEDDAVTATWLSMKLGAKRKIFSDSVPNAETFISRIAAQQLDGDPYLVIQQDGSTRPLEDWLTEALTDYREGGE